MHAPITAVIAGLILLLAIVSLVSMVRNWLHGKGSCSSCASRGCCNEISPSEKTDAHDSNR